MDYWHVFRNFYIPEMTNESVFQWGNMEVLTGDQSSKGYWHL